MLDGYFEDEDGDDDFNAGVVDNDDVFVDDDDGGGNDVMVDNVDETEVEGDVGSVDLKEGIACDIVELVCPVAMVGVILGAGVGAEIKCTDGKTKADMHIILLGTDPHRNPLSCIDYMIF